ncbi:DUF1329 domain-containing protein [Arenibaculum pallidiluteum]|uniref:DUF1329 domain-containing protein n=1 Tax=Arenibaculum pallidiluteum TaxID=2812559 RepID=UPI001A967C17|nr:DUF1329 domain-containing protein [Arenibaculum pallidiluteum]
MKKLKKALPRVLSRALLAGAVALTAGTAAAQGQLGRDLTPLGAIKAGNADGTIPEWMGGITQPPAGYSPGMHHPDPFPADQPRVTITSQNVGQHADKLSPGQVAMLKQYPTYRINVYPTRRSASAPQRIYDASIANASRAKLTDGCNGVTGAKVGIPFPVPQDGCQAMWNHLLRWRGESMTRRVGQVNPTAGGQYTMVMFEDDFAFPYAREGFDENTNVSAYFIQRVVAPARLAGEILLVHETINQVREPRTAWTYNPGQRRVRRAPNVAYDNPGTAADGLRTSDQLDMFNGALDRYDWKLLGRKEMYVPYNTYKLHGDKLSYDDIIKANHLNPDLLRYELHRVWVVDATLKPGTSHVYSRRTFYIDEDSWQILVVDHYDQRGQIWRLAEAYPINYYDVPVLWTTLEASYDLQSGRYTAVGFDNRERMYEFGVPLSAGDFSPDALRREGVR